MFSFIFIQKMDDRLCMICIKEIKQDEGLDITSCNCNYVYHKTCLDNHYEYNMTCPICEKVKIELFNRPVFVSQKCIDSVKFVLFTCFILVLLCIPTTMMIYYLIKILHLF